MSDVEAPCTPVGQIRQDDPSLVAFVSELMTTDRAVPFITETAGSQDPVELLFCVQCGRNLSTKYNPQTDILPNGDVLCEDYGMRCASKRLLQRRGGVSV